MQMFQKLNKILRTLGIQKRDLPVTHKVKDIADLVPATNNIEARHDRLLQEILSHI